MKLKVFGLAALCSVALLGSASALTLDGLVSDLTEYATDPTGDLTGPTDLVKLYVAESAGTINIGMTINSSISGANNWGKYLVYLKTNNATTGTTGTVDQWGRAADFSGSNFHPNYALASWVDSGGGAELYYYNGTSWGLTAATYNSTPGFGFALSDNGNPGPLSGVEFTLTRSLIGNASSVDAVAGVTGTGGSDNIQDVINTNGSQTNGNSNWSTATPILPATASATVPVTLSGLQID